MIRMESTDMVKTTRFYTWFFLTLCLILSIIYFCNGEIMTFVASMITLVTSLFMRTYELLHRIINNKK